MIKGADYYRVYREVAGIYCFVGETENTYLDDVGNNPDSNTTPPKYKETFVIVLVDKFCSFNEVLDDFIHRKFCGAKDTRIKWFGAGKGEKR